MSKLIITRSDEWANRLRGIKLFLDGKEMATIGNAEKKEFELLPGKYVVKAKIDWCSSNEVVINFSGDETKELILDSFAKHNPLGMLSAIYYITLGTEKYLKLYEK